MIASWASPWTQRGLLEGPEEGTSHIFIGRLARRCARSRTSRRSRRESPKLLGPFRLCVGRGRARQRDTEAQESRRGCVGRSPRMHVAADSRNNESTSEFDSRRGVPRPCVTWQRLRRIEACSLDLLSLSLCAALCLSLPLPASLCLSALLCLSLPLSASLCLCIALILCASLSLSYSTGVCIYDAD